MGRDITQLHERLREYLLDGDRLTGVRAASTGHSNETYLLEGLDLVLRMPPSAAPLLGGEYSMDIQYHLLAIVRGFAAAPPVPGVRHLCLDPEVLGDPFYLMERAAGEVIGEYEIVPWFSEASDAQRENMCRQYVDAISAVNCLPVLDVLGRPRPPSEELRDWRELAVRAQSDALVAGFDSLLAGRFASSGPPALVHGDPKLANVLWHEHRMSALLDWEMAHNGEPLRDLGYMLFFFENDHHPAQPGYGMPGMLGRQQVIESWSAATGRDPQGVERYEAAAMLEMAAILAHGEWLYKQGKSPDSRMEYWGTLVPGLVEMAEAALASD